MEIEKSLSKESLLPNVNTLDSKILNIYAEKVSRDYKLQDIYNKYRNFLTAAFLFTSASITDYYMTRSGILAQEIIELNPLLNLCVDKWGVDLGLFLPKLVLGGTLIGGCKWIEDKFNDGKSKIKDRNLLHIGTILYYSAAISIPIQKYLTNIN